MTSGEETMTRRYLRRMLNRPPDPLIAENERLTARVAELEAEIKVLKRLLEDG